jgi:hypothetical protein
MSPGTMRAVAWWPSRHARQTICMQAWRCAVIAIMLDGISVIYLLAVTPAVMHDVEYGPFPSFLWVVWALFFVSFLLHIVGCAWVIHTTMRLHRLLFPVSSGAAITSGSAATV